MFEFKKSSKQPLYHVPRLSLAWLLAAVIGVILPHVGRMPIWLTGLCVFGVVGRILIYQGKISSPGSTIKTIVVGTTFLALFLAFGQNIVSLEATVGFLIVGISLKLLEMHKKKDVLLVLYLCYFAVIAEFIFSQTLFVALYLGLCVILITTALLSLHQTQEYQNPFRTLRMSVQILLQSIPLMLALFILFPKISPMWSVSMQSTSGSTGLSANMSPGDIGELIGSDELAFRVMFETSPPGNDQLYWRALTLNQFDGRSWYREIDFMPQELTETPLNNMAWYRQIAFIGESVKYNVIMEANNQNWIYTLKVPQVINDNFIMRRDFQVENLERVGQRLSYDVESFLDAPLDQNVALVSLERSLRLPLGGNQQSRQFAAQLYQQAGSAESYIQAVLNHFNQQQFFYTLNPELLGSNSIDDFLFDSRAGFCEHYSSTFTFLMRAVGIPARVVTGYQGGEFNPYDSTLTVRQYDAHAWSEVWLEGKGWVRVDPTAAVAPERILLGSQSLQEEESYLGNSGFSMLRFRESKLLNDLRLRLEMMDYSWSRFVLNYDESMQFDFFGLLFDTVTREKITVTVLGFMFLSLSLIGLILLRKPRKHKQNPAIKHYLRFCNTLASQGFSRDPGETPRHYCQRVSTERPLIGHQIAEITTLYESLVFEYRSIDQQIESKLQRFKKLIKKFKP